MDTGTGNTGDSGSNGSNGDDWQRGKDQAKEGIREGVRAVTGFLAALKDAIDETLRDVKESGDLDAQRAKDAVRSTMRRAQNAMDDALERIDVVPRKEFDALREEVNALRARVAELEARGDGGLGTIPVDGV